MPIDTRFALRRLIPAAAAKIPNLPNFGDIQPPAIGISSVAQQRRRGQLPARVAVADAPTVLPLSLANRWPSTAADSVNGPVDRARGNTRTELDERCDPRVPHAAADACHAWHDRGAACPRHRVFLWPPRDAVAKLEGTLTGHVTEALGGLGATDAAVKPLPGAPDATRSLVGPAFPLRLISRQLGFFLVALLIIGLQSPPQAEAASPLSLQEAHRAVWKMHNPNVDMVHYRRGTATFVGPRLAVTNHHVLMGALTHTAPKDVALSQKGSSKTLRIHRVLAVSRTYDLALFETTKPGHGYLELAHHKKTSLEHLTHLTLLGYPNGKARTMKQEKQSQVRYEDEWYYSIALEAPYDYRSKDSLGNSGGPLVNAQGHIMGIVTAFSFNLTFGIKLEHVRNLIRAGTGTGQDLWWLTVCTDYKHLGACFTAERENLHHRAEQGRPVAQYRLWLLYGESSLGLSWLQKSANNDFAPSLSDLADYLTDEANSDAENAHVFRLTQLAAEQHFMLSQLELARMLLEGTGTPRNRSRAIYWLEQAADQGLNAANQALVSRH